jgi:hypothetical protein
MRGKPQEMQTRRNAPAPQRAKCPKNRQSCSRRTGRSGARPLGEKSPTAARPAAPANAASATSCVPGTWKASGTWSDRIKCVEEARRQLVQRRGKCGEKCQTFGRGKKMSRRRPPQRRPFTVAANRRDTEIIRWAIPERNSSVCFFSEWSILRCQNSRQAVNRLRESVAPEGVTHTLKCVVFHVPSDCAARKSFAPRRLHRVYTRFSASPANEMSSGTPAISRAHPCSMPL